MKNLETAQFKRHPSVKPPGLKSGRQCMLRFGLLVMMIALAACEASAGEIFQFYTGVRGLGMGGSSVAVVNDETSLLLNPAALGKIRETTVTVIDPEISGSVNNGQVATGSDFTKVFNVQGLLDKLNQAKDVPYFAKVQLFPSVVVPNFGVGVYGKFQENGEVISATNKFHLDYTNDYAAVVGYSVRLWDGIIKIGANGRYVNRTEIHKDIDPASTNLTVSSLSSQGVGLATDLGLIATAPVMLLPSLAFIAHDVGTTSYTMGGGLGNATTTAPVATSTSMDAGFAISPILSNRSRMSLTAEYHGLESMGDEKDQMRRLHAGFEFNFSDAFFFRGGLNQRYWTTGIELATERFELQFATYGEEIGTADTPREDRRYVAKFSLRF